MNKTIQLDWTSDWSDLETSTQKYNIEIDDMVGEANGFKCYTLHGNYDNLNNFVKKYYDEDGADLYLID